MPFYMITQGLHDSYFVADVLEGPADADIDALRAQWLATCYPINLETAGAEGFATWLKGQSGWCAVDYRDYNVHDRYAEPMRAAVAAWGEPPKPLRCNGPIRNGVGFYSHEWEAIRAEDGTMLWLCGRCDLAVPVDV